MSLSRICVVRNHWGDVYHLCDQDHGTFRWPEQPPHFLTIEAAIEWARARGVEPIVDEESILIGCVAVRVLTAELLELARNTTEAIAIPNAQPMSALQYWPVTYASRWTKPSHCGTNAQKIGRCSLSTSRHKPTDGRRKRERD